MLTRRFFLTLATTLVVAQQAFAGFAEYRPGSIDAALKAGKTVFVDYFATWCVTCKAQDRVLTRLLAENPAYEQNMVFIRVDWDTWMDDEVTTSRNIPRRSTLLVLRGDQELGRIVAGTGEDEIRALLDLGLK